jgi:hypothetical protein
MSKYLWGSVHFLASDKRALAHNNPPSIEQLRICIILFIEIRVFGLIEYDMRIFR